MMSKKGIGELVPSAGAHGAPPAIDRNALKWGCLVAEFLGAIITYFQPCSQRELGRDKTGWRTCPAAFRGVLWAQGGSCPS